MEPDVSRQWTERTLQDFEAKVANAFNAGKIHAPIHLSDGNENCLIELFHKVAPNDYVFSSWRSHYHALLKGVPEEKVWDEIMSGRSISLCFPEERFYSSAIVGGSLPIAVGLASAIVRRGSGEHVWCFIGDMTAEGGMANTCFKYSESNQLPITFVIEDNGLSVCTETLTSWGLEKPSFGVKKSPRVLRYRYISRFPHAGAGVRVEF